MEGERTGGRTCRTEDRGSLGEKEARRESKWA